MGKILLPGDKTPVVSGNHQCLASEGTHKWILVGILSGKEKPSGYAQSLMREIRCTDGRELKKYKGGTEAIQVVSAGSKCEPWVRRAKWKRICKFLRGNCGSFDPDLWGHWLAIAFSEEGPWGWNQLEAMVKNHCWDAADGSNRQARMQRGLFSSSYIPASLWGSSQQSLAGSGGGRWGLQIPSPRITGGAQAGVFGAETLVHWLTQRALGALHPPVDLRIWDPGM